MKKETLLVASSLVLGSSFGAGFGLYEASARGNALGGTLVGSTKDASASSETAEQERGVVYLKRNRQGELFLLFWGLRLEG